MSRTFTETIWSNARGLMQRTMVPVVPGLLCTTQSQKSTEISRMKVVSTQNPVCDCIKSLQSHVGHLGIQYGGHHRDI